MTRYDYAKAAAVAMGLVTVVTAGELTAYESSRGPTELIHWDRAKAFNGYTLIRPRGADKDADTRRQKSVTSHLPLRIARHSTAKQ